MSLDTSHECWHGAYSAFTRWRHEVARAAGYAVWKVVHDGGLTMDCVMFDWGHLPPDALNGEWPEVPADPLLVLIAHHDHCGVIHPREGRALAARLRELAPLLREDGEGHVPSYRAVTLRFAEGLERAAATGEDVGFH